MDLSKTSFKQMAISMKYIQVFFIFLKKYLEYVKIASMWD